MPTNPRLMAVCIGAFLLSSFLTYTVRNAHRTGHWFPSPKPSPHQPPLPPPRVAYATFLAASTNENEGDERPLEEDGPFTSARILAYQLLHSRTAGTNTSIPFLVLCTRDLSLQKRARLRQDGATVLLVETLLPNPSYAAHKHTLARLRLFQLVQYTKILYLSPSTLVTKPLDPIFWDEATLTASTAPLPPKNPTPENNDPAHSSLPRTYLFASHGSLDPSVHPHTYPPNYAEAHDPDPGFYLLGPSKALFEHYLSLLKMQTQQWGGGMGDPGWEVLKYAHRRQGPMGWKPLWYGWNVGWPVEEDWRGGAHSFTAKFWDGGDPNLDPFLEGIWKEQKAEMEGYYRGREEKEG